ncbi:hypothetical protein [Paraburkholderia sp. DHOC27]|uniref:hypothetical protein n=1 Tax=Paraburkholderia sp. DHOC27 TaxID=2303330 RepID=UPI000E3D92D4|nr:hypothetical protein [Paraburkholderia sp. DHOC27]RFU45111.1 hypothetical protein D0B32_25585 [Paraburkholderia sp. DHOC27]
MNKAMLGVVATGVAVVSFCMSSATFAQAGGGQGGDAHGAATAGMTYHGDPIDSPWTTKPAGWSKDDSAPSAPPATAMSTDDATHNKQPDTQ